MAKQIGCIKTDFFYRKWGCFKQFTPAPEPLAREPFADSHARGFLKMSGEGSSAHGGVLCQTIQTMRFTQMILHICKKFANSSVLRRYRIRLFDELSLPSMSLLPAWDTRGRRRRKTTARALSKEAHSPKYTNIA